MAGFFRTRAQGDAILARTSHLNITLVREDLAAIEEQIQFNPNDNNLINRYLTYARKVREFEYRGERLCHCASAA